ncbi:MAG TPA: hypothetical protein PK069_00175 [Methanolinea sp.]|nr:hypothetical protein [Methanolinea sp.]HQK55211.1 hypothetical protein [Methanolinea sp.]
MIMHLARALIALLCLMLFLGPATGAISIDAQPGTSYIGERVHISGTSDIPNIIAVYLFVTGPGLNRAGATLENLHLPAGSGYFTSAYVHPDGRFEYEWNTGFIVGHLIPGTYRIYAVSVPLNLDRLTDTDEISVSYTDVTFSRPPSPEIGIPWEVSGASLALAAALLAAKRRRHS